MQYAGVVALQGKADTEVENMVKAFAKRKNLICELLKDVKNISFVEPDGAFYVMCNVSKTGLTGDEFAKRILEEKLLAVIPCASFGAEEYIRLSYACSEENIREAVKRLKEFCE